MSPGVFEADMSTREYLRSLVGGLCCARSELFWLAHAHINNQRECVGFLCANLAVQILYVHYKKNCFILVFYLCAYINAEMGRLRVLSL